MTTSAYQETKSLGFRGVLKWYFSPYLSTLITAPVFLVLLFTILWYAARVLAQCISIAIFVPTILLLFLPVGIPLMGFSAIITYATLVGLPEIWQKRAWPSLLRLLLIVVAFIGGLMAAGMWDVLEVEAFNRIMEALPAGVNHALFAYV